MSFHKRMKDEFYDRVNPDLIMSESQRHFPEPGKEKDYDEMIEKLGGVDLCLGGLGINGHIAFNEAADEGRSDNRRRICRSRHKSFAYYPRNKKP